MTALPATSPARSHASEFVEHLARLASKDRGALAALRRSLSFAPGAYPAAFPYVEPYVGPERHVDDPFRKALYLSAGLFALHPRHASGLSLASAFGRARLRRDSGSIEQRFVALLATDSSSLPGHLRQVVSLLAAEDTPFDFARLLNDLSNWLKPQASERLDGIRQRWARDFYQAQSPEAANTLQDTPAPLSAQG